MVFFLIDFKKNRAEDLKNLFNIIRITKHHKIPIKQNYKSNLSYRLYHRLNYGFPLMMCDTFFSLQWIAVPFAMTNANVQPISNTTSVWIGSIAKGDEFSYLDSFLMLTFGGIPWQVYFQRVLSSKTAGRARILSFVAALGCLIMVVPSILIGAIAASTGKDETILVAPKQLD